MVTVAAEPESAVQRTQYAFVTAASDGARVYRATAVLGDAAAEALGRRVVTVPLHESFHRGRRGARKRSWVANYQGGHRQPGGCTGIGTTRDVAVRYVIDMLLAAAE